MRKKVTMVLAALAVAAILGGCATGGMTAEQRMAVYQQQIEAAKQPMVSVACPEDIGCNFTKLEVRDPRAAGSVRMPEAPTNGWDAAIASVGMLKSLGLSAIPVAGMYGLGKAGFDAVTDISGPTNIHNGDTVGGDQAGGDYAGGDYAQGDMAGGDQIGGDYAGDNIGDQNANSGRFDSPNETAEPAYPPQYLTVDEGAPAGAGGSE